MSYTEKDAHATFRDLMFSMGRPATVQSACGIDGWDGALFLETYNPGDGRTRYRVQKGSGKSGQTFGPFGDRWWFGAREACYCMEAAIVAINTLRRDNAPRKP